MTTRTRSGTRRGRPERLLRRRARSRTGFTLLELALALTLLGTVLLGLNRFALGSLAASATNIEMADLRRQVAYTQQLLRADLAQARACDTSGYGTPILRLDGASETKRLTMYTTATADGSAQLVEWRFYPNGLVLRMSTSREWGDLCEARITILGDDLPPPREEGQEPYQLADLLAGAVPIETIATARNVFDVRLHGTYSYMGENGSATVEEKGDYTGLCVGAVQSRCYVDQVILEFNTVTAGFEPIVTPFAWTLPVELSNARM